MSGRSQSPMRTLFSAIAFFILAAFSGRADGSSPRVILSSGLTIDSLTGLIASAEEWHPYPRLDDRSSWRSLPQAVRVAHIQQAEKYLAADWVTPKATEFLGYVRTGNRSGYQDISFGRREQLASLVLAECMEGEGRFVDDIVNGVWTICEETYWGVPAHLNIQQRGFGLPDVTEPTVDLFAAETASLLAWTWYLLAEPLDRVSPLVGERIAHEVRRRVLSVNLERDDFWWMGFGQRTNNWNPWICSNWLACVLILEQDTAHRAQAVHKILRVLDNFLSLYPDDGGCDEGPTYWNRAGGSLFDCLELLETASGGRINQFGNPLIREIGRYIYRVHIVGPWFINFADAAAKPMIDAPTVFRYGRSIGDSTMMKFAAFLAREQRLGQAAIEGRFGVLGRVLPALFTLEDMASILPAEAYLRDVWLPDLEVMSARSADGSANGLFLAAKGGHNAESHNHNDVGNFILYKDGEPVIIDLGVETYTAKTFSKDRYSIWTMQSAYHNLPTINGCMQQDGRVFQAHDVSYEAHDSGARFSLDLAAAYPAEAGVTQWLRTLTLVRGRTVTLYDQVVLAREGSTFQLTLMAPREPLLRGGGVIRIPPAPNSTGSGTQISFDETLFRVEVEAIDIEDPQLSASWGEQVFRILLTAATPPKESAFTVVFR